MENYSFGIQPGPLTTLPWNMTTIDFLAYSLGEKGNEANISLAREISQSNNKTAIRELVENLNNRNKNIQSDCIKTLYETGSLKQIQKL